MEGLKILNNHSEHFRAGLIATWPGRYHYISRRLEQVMLFLDLFRPAVVYLKPFAFVQRTQSHGHLESRRIQWHIGEAILLHLPLLEKDEIDEGPNERNEENHKPGVRENLALVRIYGSEE